MSQERHPGGRPSKFKEEYIKTSYKLALLKCKDTEIADIFGVCEATFNNWKNEYPELLEALKEGRELADANVASRLIDRAMGCTVIEERVVMTNGIPQIMEVKKEIPPDTKALELWLRNRQGKRWNAANKNEHTGEDGGPIQTQSIQIEFVDTDDDE